MRTHKRRWDREEARSLLESAYRLVRKLPTKRRRREIVEWYGEGDRWLAQGYFAGEKRIVMCFADDTRRLTVFKGQTAAALWQLGTHRENI